MKSQDIERIRILQNHYQELMENDAYDMISTVLEYEMVAAAFPELCQLVQDLKDHGEAGGGAWCSTIAANKVGFLEHPGRAIVMPISDDYEDEFYPLATQVPKITIMTNLETGYAWPAAIWKSEKGREDIVTPGAFTLEIDRKMRLALGRRVKKSFVKPPPYYVPVVMVVGSTFAFGGFWMDFQWQEKMATAECVCSEMNEELGIKRKSSFSPSPCAIEAADWQEPVLDKMRLSKYIEAPFQVQLQLPTVCQSGRLLQ